MRVVSLTCSNTEIMWALGAADLIVGVDDHSDFPEELVRDLPRVGPDLGVDPEKVAALEPDLVLASLTVPGHDKVVASLEAAGLPVEVLAPTTVEGVYRDIARVGELVGREARAAEVTADMRRTLDARPDVAPGDEVRVMVEWWPRPVIVPGKQSWVNQMLAAAGAVNPMADRDVESSPITDEEAVGMAPDAVVISWCGVPREKYRPDVVLGREAWREVPAIAGQQVHCISEAYLGRPGPRLVEGVEKLRAVVEAVRAARKPPTG